jgi:hypothetical protein
LTDYLKNGCTGTFQAHFSTSVAEEESIAKVGFTSTLMIVLAVMAVSGFVGFKLSKVKKAVF